MIFKIKREGLLENKSQTIWLFPTEWLCPVFGVIYHTDMPCKRVLSRSVTPSCLQAPGL